MFVPLSLLSASSVRLDVRAAADLVPLRDPGLSQWRGVVGAATGSRGAEVSPQRQQVSLGGRLDACAGVVASAVGNVVAHGAGRTAACGPSLTSGASGAVPRGLQLDGLSKRMGNGRGLPLAAGSGTVLWTLGTPCVFEL